MPLVALGDVLPVALSNLVFAAEIAFLPVAAGIAILRYRLYEIDRLISYNAAKTIEVFSSRLREELDLDTLSAELLAVVDQTMQPTTASLWLRPSPQGSPRAAL